MARQHQVGVDVVERVPEVPQATVVGEVAAPPLVVPVGEDAAAAGVGLEVLLEPPDLLGGGVAGGLVKGLVRPQSVLRAYTRQVPRS
jgi:hypothetical protein